MVKIKSIENKEETSEKKYIIVNLRRAKIVKWEDFDPLKKFRIVYLQIPVTVWKNFQDIDKQLPPGTLIKNVKLRINREKGFFNMLQCEIEKKARRRGIRLRVKRAN